MLELSCILKKYVAYISTKCQIGYVTKMSVYRTNIFNLNLIPNV